MYLSRAKDPLFWQGVREKDMYAPMRAELKQMWEARPRPYPVLPWTEYRRFVESGDRAGYETLYFARRKAMCAAAILALIEPENKAYLDEVENVLWAICGEYSWCLPAHQPKGDVLRDHIDLFASETGYALSEILALLGDRLHPAVARVVRENVESRVIDRYADESEPPFFWETCTNNWAAVCCAGVCAAVINLRPDLFERLYPRFEATMKCFLAGYGDDGFCAEGVGYWNYGFGFFVTWADMVREHTCGRIDWFANEKVKSISTFLQKVFLSGRATVSFSDGARTATPHPALMHYLHREYGDAVTPLDCSGARLSDNAARWCLHLRGFVWLDGSYVPQAADGPSVCYGRNAEWYIKKTACYGFAAKAGHNEEFHNHNDVGSFVIAKEGRQIFGDFGSGLYTRQYFVRETRYEIFVCASFGHSVPLFGDPLAHPTSACQKNGREYKATQVTVSDDRFGMELSGAYAEERVKSVRRDFVLRDDRITLTDRFETEAGTPCVERFLLMEKPALTDDGFEAGGLRCRVSGAESICVREESVPCHAPGTSLTVWTVDCVVNGKAFEMEIDCR
ncbi:MAG: heparinase II/III family protein [Clostridia bacterium]|nr:heparinase II/III family protein [Clostridia bacterium]